MKRALLVAMALATAPLAAQDDTPLRTGQTLAGTLASDSRHTYTVELADETFVSGHVNQISVDVVVTVLDPDGEQVAEFDSPARGPEDFQFTADRQGRFVIRVTPFEEQEGDYEILVERAEPVATDPSDRIDQLMTRFSGDDTPGAVVGVLDKGEVVFERAYGMASLEYGIEHEVGTPTNIGSVTKQFTAMSILLLQNDGLLSLDDEVRKHIPELPDFGTPVTLKNLLNHTGGFREIYNLLPMTGRAGEDAIRREEAIQIVQRQPELQAAPNTEYNYNNTGFILLATVVERVSRKTFPEFMKERVFEPLGMMDTRVKYEQGEIIPGASTGYVRAEGGGWRSSRDLAASAGAGGIYTTFRDMTKWMLNYRDATVGGAHAIRALTTRNILASGDTSTYALGLGIGQMRGRTLYTHTGGDTAHRTYFGYLPELQAGIFISSNNATFAPTFVAEIADLFFGDRLNPIEEDDEASEETEGVTDGTMTEERMEAIVGDWLIEGLNIPIELTSEDGSLYAQAEGQGRFRLTPTSDSTAVFTAAGISIVFHFEDDESVSRSTFTQGQSREMNRFNASGPSAEEMEALAGRYFSNELELWLDVQWEDEELVIHRLQAEPMTLTHRVELTFGGSNPFAEIVFQRASNGMITGLLAANGRTKGVLFTRR